METIRAILEAHESGISRGGLLAWARLRGDPTMTDEQMEAALAELGDQVVDVQGFLYLRRFAPASALAAERVTNAGEGAAAPPVPSPAPPEWAAAPPAPPSAPPVWPTASPTPVAGAIPGWVSPDAGVVPPAWPAARAGAIGAAVPQPGAEDQAWGSPPQPGAEGQVPPADGWTPPDGGWPPTQPSSGRRTMVVATVAVGAFLLAAGIGALLLRDADPGGGASASPALPTPTSGSVIGAFTLVVGDCLILPSEDQFDEVRHLECTEPHDGEVFHVEAYPGSDYPSDDAFSSYVDQQCLPAFTEYTGSDFNDQAILDMGWFTPTQGSWDNGDRDVACYLTPVDGEPTSQSYRGAKP